MQNTEKYREIETGTKASPDNELISKQELALTGVAAFLVNAYYSPGTLINRVSGNEDMDAAYKKQTGSNLVEYDKLTKEIKSDLKLKTDIQAGIEKNRSK